MLCILLVVDIHRAEHKSSRHDGSHSRRKRLRSIVKNANRLMKAFRSEAMTVVQLVMPESAMMGGLPTECWDSLRLPQNGTSTNGSTATTTASLVGNNSTVDSDTVLRSAPGTVGFPSQKLRSFLRRTCSSSTQVVVVGYVSDPRALAQALAGYAVTIVTDACSFGSSSSERLFNAAQHKDSTVLVKELRAGSTSIPQSLKKITNSRDKVQLTNAQISSTRKRRSFQSGVFKPAPAITADTTPPPVSTTTTTLTTPRHQKETALHDASPTSIMTVLQASPVYAQVWETLGYQNSRIDTDKISLPRQLEYHPKEPVSAAVKLQPASKTTETTKDNELEACLIISKPLASAETEPMTSLACSSKEIDGLLVGKVQLLNLFVKPTAHGLHWWRAQELKERVRGAAQFEPENGQRDEPVVDMLEPSSDCCDLDCLSASLSETETTGPSMLHVELSTIQMHWFVQSLNVSLLSSASNSTASFWKDACDGLIVQLTLADSVRQAVLHNGALRSLLLTSFGEEEPLKSSLFQKGC